jgi:prepilin-type N-terminal cleavage/methylation domain-containing protein
MRLALTRRRGFTLIEALVAFAILALSLGQLLRSVSAGAENERRADFMTRAAADGQSQLAALGAELPLVAGETAGRYDDGLVWTLNVARDRAIASVGGAPLVTAWRVRLEIRSPTAAAQGLTLVGEKLIAPEPAGRAP